MSFPDLSYCRLCAKQKPKDKLTDYHSKEREYNNNFKKLIRLNAIIDLSEETLPKTFCFMCIGLLEQAFEFVLQVEKAQELLRNVFLLQNVKTEEEPITSEENDNNVASEQDLCIKIETLDIPSSFIPLDDVSATPALKCEKKYRSYLCHVCDRRFNQSGHLAIHMRKHTGERPYPCDLCPKAFKVKVERDDHRRTHTGERPFACTVCPKTFTAAARLREHARTHTDQRPYPCDICGAAFRRPYARTVHTLIHTGEKPYECDICGTPFRRSGDLGKHKRTVHGMIRAILPTVPQTKKSRFYS